MTEWYYARGGKQSGPVSHDVLVGLARNGGLDPIHDLVWTSTMKDWLPAGQVPGIFTAPVQPADPPNPYAAPASDGADAGHIPQGEAVPEIIPGSQPLNAGGCIKRGFDLTIRHFGMILLIGLTYILVLKISGTVLNTMDSALELPPAHGVEYHQANSGVRYEFFAGYSTSNSRESYLNIVLTNVISTFLSLGLVRIGLNIVSGKPFSIAMLFGGGRKLIPAFLGSILYMIMVALGTILLVFPGIYLALRYSQYLYAMVDRDLGILDAFKYSASITTHNRMNLFTLFLLMILVFLAGFLALLMGLIVAFPVVWLSWVVAYRWMQFGYAAALDRPGTRTPMLDGIP